MKALNIVKYVLTVIGAGMLVGTFFLYKSTSDFIEKSVETQGTVIELLESRSKSSSDNSIMYKPLVAFTDAKGTEVEFASSTSSNPPSYSVNEKVDVIYNPESPNKAKIKGFFSLWGGAMILGILGLIVFLIGFGIIVSSVKKKNMLKHLKTHGTRIESDFQNVTLNTTLAVNGQNPYVVVSQWQNPTTSELHLFTSDNIWFDPTDFIKTDKINVLIDKKDPKKYAVDLSFLPKVAG
ncbi:DUF3592 domain-containing protein [Cellulophaga fucicola]|uniref:DUF3592 domain-containing protein n=1 Tax=Cellulophaga fucicola TaxID=76595 RepID=A0A1K1QKP6_9FLAO|nr:DUF3592 domain-containing protein [Cellulophaga fucicola]SFW60341.1 Protein of unknown function [Cellulophaga fucicola]